MVLYRRNYVPGDAFFFTLALQDRRSDWLVRHVALLREAMAELKAKRPFSIEAMVVRPEHLHAIWTLPPGDQDYSGRWRAIKSAFVQALGRQGIALARNGRGEAEVWQPRFWEHTIRDEQDMHRHVDYIHFNPVKHGYVDRPADWPHSSIHRFIEAGHLAPDWGAGDRLAEGEFGESI